MSDPRDGCPDCGDIDHHAADSVIRRYHAGWYIVSASAPLRDVWCKDHYPDDGYVTEELTSAEADAFRRALDASPTVSPTETEPHDCTHCTTSWDGCNDEMLRRREACCSACRMGVTHGQTIEQDRRALDASPTEGNPE